MSGVRHFPALEQLQARMHALALEGYELSAQLIPLGAEVETVIRAGARRTRVRVCGRSPDGMQIDVRMPAWEKPMRIGFHRVVPIVEVADARPAR